MSPCHDSVNITQVRTPLSSCVRGREAGRRRREAEGEWLEVLAIRLEAIAIRFLKVFCFVAFGLSTTLPSPVVVNFHQHNLRPPRKRKAANSSHRQHEAPGVKWIKGANSAKADLSASLTTGELCICHALREGTSALRLPHREPPLASSLPGKRAPKGMEKK